MGIDNNNNFKTPNFKNGIEFLEKRLGKKIDTFTFIKRIEVLFKNLSSDQTKLVTSFLNSKLNNLLADGNTKDGKQYDFYKILNSLKK